MGVTVTVSLKIILYGSSSDTNSSFFTVSWTRGEIPRPLLVLMAKASAFQVVIVSGTSELYRALPAPLQQGKEIHVHVSE